MKTKTINPKELKSSIESKYTDEFIKIKTMIEDKRNKLVKPKGFFKSFFYNMNKVSIDKELRNVDALIKSHEKFNEDVKLKQIVTASKNLVERRNLIDIQGWKNQIADLKTPGKTFLVNMELRNGMHTHFLIVLIEPYYIYEDGAYIIDDNYKYYDVASKIWCLDYHQDCCLPLKRRFDLTAIQEAVERSDEIDTETSINPKSLKIFMESDIIQKVMKGAEMENWIKFVKLMLILDGVGILIILILIIKQMF